jgi:uncharacterized membrane protein
VRFCAACGAPQPASSAPPRPGAGLHPATSFNPRTAAMLCYLPVAGWLVSIVVLASEQFRRDRDTRFHAFQGLYLFVIWLMNSWVFKPLLWINHDMGSINGLIELVLLAVGVFMMVKTAHGVRFSLPIVGELAERSVAES